MGVITRRVQMFGNEERIKDAYRFGKLWRMLSDAILLNAHKKSEEPTLPMSRESPFLERTNLYPSAGKADECVGVFHLSESTVNHDITRIINKAGLLSKKELAFIL